MSTIVSTDAIVDFLSGVIADRQRSPEDKDRAAKALAFYSIKEDEANAATARAAVPQVEATTEAASDAQPVATQSDQASPSPETVEQTRQTLLAYGREGAKMLWYTPGDCVYSSFTTKEGVVHQKVTSKRFGGLRPDEFYEFIPDSGPAPQLGKSRADDVIPDVQAPTFGLPEFAPAVPLPVLPPTDTEMLARKEAFQSLDERYSDANVAVRLKAVEDAAADLRAMRDQPSPVITTAPPPSAEEQRAVAEITLTSPTEEKIAAIQQDSVKPLTTVESIEARINEERDVRARYDAAQENLARLIALRDQQA